MGHTVPEALRALEAALRGDDPMARNRAVREATTLGARALPLVPAIAGRVLKRTGAAKDEKQRAAAAIAAATAHLLVPKLTCEAAEGLRGLTDCGTDLLTEMQPLMDALNGHLTMCACCRRG